MSNRELVVLGTASQAPTRARNHNGYFLRWDDEGLLFDPGEGTQRQMLFAGVTAHQITRICVTHFHGDHCLGLPGVLQRMALDEVTDTVEVAYPASGAGIFDRMRHISLFHDRLSLREHRVPDDGCGPRRRAGLPAGGPPAVAPRPRRRLPPHRTRRPPHAARRTGGARHRGPGHRTTPARRQAGTERHLDEPRRRQRAPPRPEVRLRHGHPPVRRRLRTRRGRGPAGLRVDVRRRRRRPG